MRWRSKSRKKKKRGKSWNMIFSYGRNITYIPIYNFNYSNVNIVINNSNNYIQLNNQIFLYPEEYSCYSLPKKDEKDNKLRKK